MIASGEAKLPRLRPPALRSVMTPLSPRVATYFWRRIERAPARDAAGGVEDDPAGGLQQHAHLAAAGERADLRARVVVAQDRAVVEALVGEAEGAVLAHADAVAEARAAHDEPGGALRGGDRRRGREQDGEQGDERDVAKGRAHRDTRHARVRRVASAGQVVGTSHACVFRLRGPPEEHDRFSADPRSSRRCSTPSPSSCTSRGEWRDGAGGETFAVEDPRDGEDDRRGRRRDATGRARRARRRRRRLARRLARERAARALRTSCAAPTRRSSRAPTSWRCS